MRRSSRSMTPFYVMDVMERSKDMESAGRSIVHLEVGEPDFPTPECVIEAAGKALRDGHTHYTSSLGLLELREAIAEHYHDTYGVTVSPDRIVITSGSSPAMLLTFTAILERGDRVILSDPHYACYPNFLVHLDAEPVFIETKPEEMFQCTAADVSARIDSGTRAIIINSPANPTGTLIDREELRAICELGVTVVSDEIYHGLVYEGKESSALEFTDNAIVINGFSKLYAMTGWRLGYLIVPAEYVRTIQVLQQNFFISPNDFVQHAGVAALREAGDDAARMVARFDERRRFVLKRLREIGLNVPCEPHGAFYVWVESKKFGEDSLTLANRILDETGVAVAPGMDFGESGRHCLRISYANNLENIAEGMRRLEKFVASNRAL
jgi:aspartate/methionine/tyrosine aminotransferase